MFLRKIRITGVSVMLALSYLFLSQPSLARGYRPPPDGEIDYPAEEFAKLDTFEGLNLEDGDKLFAKKDYKGAFAEYKAYSTDFPKGKAVAYAVLRMGRCLHLMKKRGAAIRYYQEVVDYFPNDVRYAAGALYFMGLAHQENGDEKKCIATWARMVKDKDYVKRPHSGRALNYLADAMNKAGEYEEGAEYRWRIAIEFRKSNPRVAQDAKNGVFYHYVIRSPNHEKFMEFYKEVGGWHSREDLKDLDNSQHYWRTVLDKVRNSYKYESKAGYAERKKAASYWVAKFGGKFLKSDDLQRKIIDIQLLADGNREAWIARMRKQADSMPMSVGRLGSWLGVFKDNPAVQSDLLKKHAKVVAGATVSDAKNLIQNAHQDFRRKLFDEHLAKAVPGMKRSEQLALIDFLRRHVGMPDAAKAVLSALNMKGVTDEELVGIARIAGDLAGETAAMGYFSRMKDKKKALKARYDWYLGKALSRGGVRAEMAEKALSLMTEVAKYPEWAQATLWPKASLLHGLGRYPEAIKAYKATNKQPDATWKVAECLIAMKNYAGAITTVKALESVGGNTAAQACLKVADIYKMSGNKTKEIEQLRLVLHRYPKSGQSSAAHQRLEGYGAKVTGGRAKAD